MASAEIWPPDRIVIHSEYREKENVKQVPGARWHDRARVWHAPLSWATCVALRGVFGDSLTVGDELDEWAAREIAGRVEPCLRVRDAEDCDPEWRAGIHRADDLEPRQRAGVQFLVMARRSLCGDGMGSGKTVENICAVETMAAMGLDPYPCLVICTNSMVYEWEKEINRWAPDRTVGVLKGTAPKRRKALESRPDWLVINWELTSKHTRLAPYGMLKLKDKEKEPKELNSHGLRTVIADESHKGRNPKAQMTRAWWQLSWDAELAIGNTGTFVEKSPTDFWSQMHGLCPQEWPSKTAWIDRYGMQSWNYFGGMSVVGLRGDTRDELFRFMDARFIRRPTEVVIPNIAKKLPPQVRELDLTPKQRTAYNAVSKQMMAELDGGVLVATTALSKLTRMLQLASSHGVVDEAGDFRAAEPSNKLDALEDLLEELVDQPLVVFAESRQLLELAAARLEKREVPFGEITGRVQPRDRSENIERFQAGETRVMLVTLGAGGEGVTLTRAAHCAYLQRSFSMLKDKQSVDRLWRRGQDRDVQPIYFVSKDTVESRVDEVLAEKYERFEEIARDKETVRRFLEGE